MHPPPPPPQLKCGHSFVCGLTSGTYTHVWTSGPGRIQGPGQGGGGGVLEAHSITRHIHTHTLRLLLKIWAARQMTACPTSYSTCPGLLHETTKLYQVNHRCKQIRHHVLQTSRHQQMEIGAFLGHASLESDLFITYARFQDGVYSK